MTKNRMSAVVDHIAVDNSVVNSDDIDLFLDTCEERRLGYLDAEVTAVRVSRAYNGKLPAHIYTDNGSLVLI